MSMRVSRRISGLGLAFSPEQMRMLSDVSITGSRGSALLASVLGPSGGGGGPGAMNEECLCKAEQVLTSMGMNDPALLNQLAIGCTAAPEEFQLAADEAGVSLESCKPWYMRKTTWIVGGLLAAGGVALVVLK